VHAARPELVLAAGSAAATPAFTAALAPGTQADLVLAAPVPAPGAALRAFRADFRRTYGRRASPAAAFGHASMQTVLRAIAAAGAAGGGNRREVGEALLGASAGADRRRPARDPPDGDPTLERVRRLEVRGGRAVPDRRTCSLTRG
jgi:hypothetical protein